jgi:hypothetical protein
LGGVTSAYSQAHIFDCGHIDIIFRTAAGASADGSAAIVAARARTEPRERRDLGIAWAFLKRR